jgi:hypothetical protein
MDGLVKILAIARFGRGKRTLVYRCTGLLREGDEGWWAKKMVSRPDQKKMVTLSTHGHQHMGAWCWLLSVLFLTA